MKLSMVVKRKTEISIEEVAKILEEGAKIQIEYEESQCQCDNAVKLPYGVIENRWSRFGDAAPALIGIDKKQRMKVCCFFVSSNFLSLSFRA